MIINAVTPAIVPPKVQDSIVLVIEKFENLFTTQKPESLGRESPIPPAQIASPTRIGETPRLGAIGPKIEEAVTKATVVDPCAARRI